MLGDLYKVSAVACGKDERTGGQWLGTGAVIGIAGAAAGAPVAALGSMATQTKRNTKLMEQQVRSTINGI